MKSEDSIDVGRKMATKISNLDYLALAVLCDELMLQNRQKADWISNLLERLINKTFEEEKA